MFVKNFLKKGGLSMPSITTSSWLSASEPPPIPPGNMKLRTPFRRAVSVDAPGDCGARSAKRRSRQRWFSRMRSPDGLSAPNGPYQRRSWTSSGLEATGRAAEARVERLPAHADGVDLVDEDDALTAPLAREPLRAPREDADDDRVDADERGGEARTRDRDERRVESGRERFREHRLPGAGRAEEEEAALALATRALERLARLPDRDDPAHLLLRLGLATHVRELDAPLRVSRLEALDLREVHDQKRSEQDHEVHDQEEREDDEQRNDLDEQRRVEEEIEREEDQRDDDRRLQPEAPEPDTPPRDDVFLAQLPALEPEEARARDQAVEEEVDDTAEADDGEERREDRPVPGPALRLVQPDDDGRRGEERNRGRDAGQTAPLVGELVRELGLLETPHGLRFGRHLRSVGTPRRAEGWCGRC